MASFNAVTTHHPNILQQTIRNLDGDHIAALHLVQAYPQFEVYIGLEIFSSYRARRPGDLAMFLYAIFEHPQFCHYIRELDLNAALDGLWGSRLLPFMCLIGDRFVPTTSLNFLRMGNLAAQHLYDGVLQHTLAGHLYYVHSLLYVANQVRYVRMPLNWAPYVDWTAYPAAWGALVQVTYY
ncbi:hypothetical protein BDV95DRAFT_602166 [Massariosphaeria phaeospora]|uniref:Uncharacterized protein n=1 Tax=Massariosphaeria phaeospora TaxID=100035 RepID=A0A7C8ICI1_9PLEO|nr:hypothetical protein BDV95DRAFT_602166 [Massariosphaeria phaeospora]